MRFLVRATIPVETGNELVRSGADMGALLETVMSDVRPEAVYFCIENGNRTLYAVVDIADSADSVRVAEPFWLSLSCDVEFIPAMTQDDFGKAMQTIGSIAGKY
jgi:hypothetical protein